MRPLARFALAALLCAGHLLACDGSSLRAARLQGTGLNHATLNVAASPPRSGGHPSSGTDAGGVLLQQTPDQKVAKKKFSDCMILAVIGGSLLAAAVLVTVLSRRMREEAEFLLGDKARRTNAQITGKRHYITGSGDDRKEHYAASYTFEGVRDDGMRCSVTVTERDHKRGVWDAIEVGRDMPVLYAVENPGHCSLAQQAMAESQDDSTKSFAVLILLGFGCGCCAYSAHCGLHSTWGVTGFYSCVGACLVIVGGGFLLALRAPSPDKSNVTQLGLQTKAAHLEDLSGLWLLETEFENFEYSFDVVSTVVVMVKGRIKGKEDWDLEFEAHFAGEEGNELVWNDDEKANFRLLFDASDSFTGSRCGGAGDEFAFKGSRISPAAASASQ